MRNRPTRSIFLHRLNQFTDTIRQDIHSGALVPGVFLPAETELADQYQLSKLSIRKGLEQLVEEGLIEKIPRVGNRIAAGRAADKQVVRFACHQSLIREAEIEPLIARFEADNPDIKIQLILLPFQQYVESIGHYMDNEMIDILSISYDQYAEFSRSDRLDMFAAQEPDPDMYPFVQKGFVQQGKMYAKPFVFSPIVLCYNRRHFAEKRLPEPDSEWTWQTLIETADRLAERGERYGFYFHLLSQNRWPVFLLQNGYNHADAEATASRDRRFLESMSFCKSLITGQKVQAVLIPDDDLYAEKLFSKEKASMIMTTYFNLNHLRGSGIPFEVAPLPYMKEPRTLLLSIALSVMDSSPRKEAAQRFVDYMTGYESQLHIRRHSLSIPAHKLAAETQGEDAAYHPSRFSMYREIIPSFRYSTELGVTTQQLMQMRNELSLYWSELSDGDQLLEVLEHI